MAKNTPFQIMLLCLKFDKCLYTFMNVHVNTSTQVFEQCALVVILELAHLCTTLLTV